MAFNAPRKGNVVRLDGPSARGQRCPGSQRLAGVGRCQRLGRSRFNL